MNKPGAEIDELKGGVAGGSILTGVLKLGDEVEVNDHLVETYLDALLTIPRSGRESSQRTRKAKSSANLSSAGLSPYSQVRGLISVCVDYANLEEHNDLKFAVPGGLIGVGTRVDPTLCRADRLVGFVLGLKGKLPDIYNEIEINYFLLRRLLGVKTTDGKQAKVAKLTKNEVLMVNIGSTATVCQKNPRDECENRTVLTVPGSESVGGKS